MRHARHLWLFTISIVFVLVLCESATARTWTDSTGKHTIEADFVSLDSGTVKLKTAVGDMISLPLEKLSNADQEFAKSAASKAENENPFTKSVESPKQVVKGACRVLITISETGDCTFEVAPQYLEGVQDKPAETLPIAHDDGTMEYRHRLTTQEGVDAVLGVEARNVAFDPIHKALLLTPKAAGFTYPKLIHFPVELEVDFSRPPSDGNFIVLLRRQGTTDDRSPLFYISSSTDTTTAKVKCSWIPSRDNNNNPVWEDLLKETTTKVEESKKYNFRFSGPNVVINDPFQIRIALSGTKPASVTFLSVRGKIAPLFGIQWAKQDDLFFAKYVYKNSLADKAGVQKGDVLVTANGQSATSMQQAVDLLQKIDFGDTCTLVIKRGDKELTIPIKAE